jgi:hypothetical protein
MKCKVAGFWISFEAWITLHQQFHKGLDFVVQLQSQLATDCIQLWQYHGNVWNAMVSCCAWLIASIKFTHFCTQSTTSIFTFVFFPPPYATTLFSQWFSSSISFSSQFWKLLIFVVWSSFANNFSATFYNHWLLAFICAHQMFHDCGMCSFNIAILTINIINKVFHSSHDICPNWLFLFVHMDFET